MHGHYLAVTIYLHVAPSPGGHSGYEHCGTRQARSTLRLNAPGLGWLFAELLLQHPSKSRQERDA